MKLETERAMPAAKARKGSVGEEARRLQLNQRNRRAKLKARTITGPLVWCGDVRGSRSGHDPATCGRCGPRTVHHSLGKLTYASGTRQRITISPLPE